MVKILTNEIEKPKERLNELPKQTDSDKFEYRSLQVRFDITSSTAAMNMNGKLLKFKNQMDYNLKMSLKSHVNY